MRRKTLPAGQKRRRGRKSRLRTCAGQAPGRGAFSGGACPLPRRTPERFRAKAATAGNLRRRGRLKGRPSPQRESPCSSQERLHGAVAACGKSSPHGETQEAFPRPPETAKPPPLLPAEGGAFRRFPLAFASPRPPPLRQKTGYSDRGRQPFNIVFLMLFSRSFFPCPSRPASGPSAGKNSLTKNTFKDI